MKSPRSSGRCSAVLPSTNERWKVQPPMGRSWARFLITNACIGGGLGLAVAAGLLLTNPGGLGALFADSDARFAAGIIFFLSFAATFASLSLATAIMRLPKDED